MSDAPAKEPTLKPMDPADLYEVRTFSDLVAGDIRAFVPVTPDGSSDPMRRAHFYSSCQANHRGRAYPVRFEIEASSLSEAVAAFAAAGERAATEFVEKLRDMETRATILMPAGPPN